MKAHDRPTTTQLPAWPRDGRQRTIDMRRLGQSPTLRILAYLYLRQAYVDSPTLARIGGIRADSVSAHLTPLLHRGEVVRLAKGTGLYRLGAQIPTRKAQKILAAVRYVTPARVDHA